MASPTPLSAAAGLSGRAPRPSSASLAGGRGRAPGLSGLLLAAGLLVGCGGDKGDSADEELGEEIPGGGDTDTPECGGAAPVVTEIQCSADGVKEYEPGSSLPTLLFKVFVEDEDADLESMELSLYYDDTIDGAVSTQEAPYPPSIITIDDTSCVNPSATVNLSVFVSGVDPRFNRNYEWSVVVRDANDVASEPFVFECITPFENGDEGNGEG